MWIARMTGDCVIFLYVVECALVESLSRDNNTVPLVEGLEAPKLRLVSRRSLAGVLELASWLCHI